MRTWLRRWPLSLIVAGLALAMFYGLALLRRPPERGREAPDPLPMPREEFVQLESKVCELAREKKFEEALSLVEPPLGRRDLLESERGGLLVLKGRLRKELKKPAESTLRAALASRCTSRQRATAYNELAEIKWDAGDFEGAIAVLLELIDSCVDDTERAGSNIMDVEANYRHFACMGIASCHEKLGNGKQAFAWVQRAKFDYPFDAGCGNAIHMAHEAVEERLAELAPLAGRSYTAEEFDWDRWSRRRYGPPEWECYLGVTIGAVLAALGVWIARRRLRRRRASR